MNPEIKADWVAALRNGEYEQSKGVLRDNKGFCCLGVLCDIYAKRHGEEWVPLQSSVGSLQTMFGAETYLPYPVMEWAGLPASHGDEITIQGEETDLPRANDSGSTFLEIADAIEAQL